MQRVFQQALRPTARALQTRTFRSTAARLDEAAGKPTQVALSFQTPYASLMEDEAVDMVIVPGVEGRRKKGRGGEEGEGG